MDHKSGSDARAAIGIDAGATLTKLAIEHPSGDLHLERFAREDRAALVALVTDSMPAVIGLTGGAGAAIQASLHQPELVDEFSAWAAGARRLLGGRTDADRSHRYLLVSLGTGTSIQRVDGSTAQRIAGTALGGGTMLGLGRLVTGSGDFARLCELASRGERRAVDLLLSDVYEGVEVPLGDHITASSFGKLARDPYTAPEAADAAAGVFHLVAENVGLAIGHAARATETRQVWLGGSSLVPLLTGTLTAVLAAFGCEVGILPNGEYTGALGAIELLRDSP